MARPMKMMAAVVHRFGQPLELQEVDVPRVSTGQVLVKLGATGVCHTDLHAAMGDWPVKPVPSFIPGHEGVGTVVELGEGVTRLKVGDHVGVPWLHTACGHCEHCLGGWETLCDAQQMTGYTVNGTFAEYVVADANFAALVPEGLEFAEAAPVLCAGVTVYKGLKVLECKPGDWVAISGIGGLGHMAVQYAKAMGFHVAAIDLSSEKLALAKKLGAELVVNASSTDPVMVLQRELKGAHGVLVTAVSNRAFEQGIGMLHKRGTMALVGLPPGGFELPIFDMVLNAKTVRGSIVGTRKDLDEALGFAAEGKVRAHFTTDVLENINAIFERMKKGLIDGRVVLEFPNR